MKARIKETGDPIEDLIIYDSTGNQWSLDDVELIPDTPAPKEIDWEQRRFELVKATMQGFLVHKGAMLDTLLVNRFFELADAILEKYRKGGEQ